MSTIGVVGGGSLGKALIMQYWNNHCFNQVVSTRTIESKQKFKIWMQKEAPIEERTHFINSVHITTQNRKVAHTSQVLLCVKANQAKAACKSIREHLAKETVVVSAMAAVPLEYIQEWLNHDSVVRIMPTVINKAPICVYNPNACDVLLPHTNTIVFENETGLDGAVGYIPELLTYVLNSWIEAVTHMGYNDKTAEQLVLSNFKAIAQNNMLPIENTSKEVIEILQTHNLDNIFTEMCASIEEKVEETIPEK